MSAFFVDTSALAKRYIIETGSAWVRSWILPSGGHSITISALSTVEMVSLLMRREREGAILKTVRIRVQNSFLRHASNQYQVIELNNPVLKEARDLLTKYELRSLDALQLASAIQVARIISIKPTFISADTRLLDAAAEGFATDNPNAHP